MSAPSVTELEHALRAAWSMWTADPADHDEWSAADPASGQCASTALIVHDTFGGALLMGHVRRADGTPAGVHYSNRLHDGIELDLTREQFRDGERVVEVAEVEIPSDRDRLRGRMTGPYNLLAARVARELQALGAAGSERPVSVKGVCSDAAGQVLLARNHRGEWELPGGRPEPGEDFAETLRRELCEETGLQVEVGSLVGVGELQPLPGRWVDIVAFACAPVDAAPAAVSGDEHSQVCFRDPAELTPAELPEVYRKLISRR